MLIEPQGIFILCKNVPFNSSYSDTILFRSKAEQELYFKARGKQFLKFTYMRNNGTVRLQEKADDLYEYNYCMYQNTGFGNKWFYAFVTGTHYVNADVTELQLETDLLQSWMFDFSIGKCYVEREHVKDDTVGKHTIPENLPFGDTVMYLELPKKMNVTPVVKFEGGKSGGVVNNIYDPLVSAIGSDNINQVLDDNADTPEKIAYLKMGFSPESGQMTFTRPEKQAFTFRGDSYTPVNNKLYIYPYCSFSLDDYGENVELYKWEDFADAFSAVFDYQCAVTPYPYVAVTPNSYKGKSKADNFMFVKTDFPDCPYVIDNFRAWSSSVGMKQQISYEAQVAQNTVNSVGEMVQMVDNAAGQTAGTIASGNPMNMTRGGLLSGSYVNRILNERRRDIGENATQASMNVDREYAKTHGTSIGGQVGGGTVPWIMGKTGFRFMSFTIRPEYARSIDEFFTRFGYKVDTYKVPETTSRSTFNYVKTIRANITGEAPDYALKGISRIFDNGITLWHNTNVGTYTVNEIRKE